MLSRTIVGAIFYGGGVHNSARSVNPSWPTSYEPDPIVTRKKIGGQIVSKDSAQLNEGQVDPIFKKKTYVVMSL
jgi:hypothetical protein